CCQKASREDIRELHFRNDKAFQLRSEGWTEEAVMLDPRFRLHQRIADIAGHGVLDRLRKNLRVLVIVPLPGSDNPELSHAEHREIIEAIAENRPDDAERLARNHVRMTKQRIELEIEAGAFQPQWGDGAFKD